MKTTYVLDLVKNQVIEAETFAIFESEEAKDKNGNSYYNLLLGDKTGRISAKIWADKLINVSRNTLKKDKVVQVSAKVEEFRGKLQLNIHKINEIDESALEEFLESSDFNPEEMYAELMNEVNKFKDQNLKELILKIFNDSEIVRKYKFWPAASTVHHDFRSGLLQHVVEMISISKSLPRFYEDVNYDLLTSAIILHDIGKIIEFDASGAAANYTVEGSLLGHIILGIQLIDKFGAKEILPREIYLHLIHLITSHHGQLEYGSPVLPSTVEAIMLTCIDNLSAKSRTALKARNNIIKGQDFSTFITWLNGAKIWRSKLDNDSSEASDNSTQSNSDESNEFGQLVF